ncbi:helix-turn-helix domain-containing protein [Undibacterium sp. TJN19]|uniref:helix-turn-helix domain-containing protein n=1 Tax=Undibacterium sp. TJN19 TaxID=3413055 RepID=UPI003BF3B4FE
MSHSDQSEPALSEVTGTFHYQELIDSRLGQPIAADLTDAEAEKLALSPGAKLAAGRNAMGWSVEQVAAQLKMAPRQIISIEKDDYAALPEAAIVKGFVRAYAKLLKLDPAVVVALVIIAPDKNKTAATSRAVVNTANKETNSLPVKAILFVFLLAALAIAYFNLIH